MMSRVRGLSQEKRSNVLCDGTAKRNMILRVCVSKSMQIELSSPEKKEELVPSLRRFYVQEF